MKAKQLLTGWGGLRRGLAAVSIAGAVGLVSSGAWAGVKELRELALKTPASAQEGLALAVRLRNAGLLQEAMQTVYRSLGKTPDAETTTRLVLEKARIEIEKGRMKHALIECEKLKKTEPVVFHVCSAEAYLLFRRGSLALADADAALALKSGDYDATLARGRALWVSGQAEESRKVLSDLLAANPNRPEVYPHLGEILIGINQKAEAIKVLRRGLKAAPDDAMVRVMLARLLPPTAEAAQLLGEAAEMRYEFFEAYSALGVLQLQLRKLDEAEQSLSKALKLRPKDPDAMAALAEVFLLRPDLEAALKQARAALKLMPNNGPAKLIEAEALAAKGEIDLAIEVYQAAYGLQRRNPDVLIRGARACVTHGRPTTALAFAELASTDFPESGPSFEVLGDVLAAGGDKKGARVAYNDALKKQNPADPAVIKKKLAALK